MGDLERDFQISGQLTIRKIATYDLLCHSPCLQLCSFLGRGTRRRTSSATATRETVNRSWSTSPIYTQSECGRLLGSWGGRARYWACGATNTGRETCGKCYISRNGRAVVDLANFPLDWNPSASHHLPRCRILISRTPL